MTTQREQDLVEAFITIVLVVPVMILGAYVGQMLWGWFIVPLGVVPISMSHAFGISVLASYWMKGDSPKSDDSVLVKLFGSVFKVLMLWFCGWIAHIIMT